MTAVAVGLCSGTLPAASARELARVTRSAGGSGVDLRIGKGHAWEADGVPDGLRTLGRAGLDVFFTGLGLRLGRADAPDVADELLRAPTGPVKVFCAPGPDAGLVREQVREAAGHGRPLWIETHDGGPAAPALTELAQQTGAGIVLDLLGLVSTGGATDAELDAMAPHVRAVQVKGVLAEQGRWRHRPLRATDLHGVVRVLRRGTAAAVTVESRAGRPEDDLRVLIDVLKESGFAVANPSAAEETAS